MSPFCWLLSMCLGMLAFGQGILASIMVSYVAKKILQKLGRPRGGDTNMEVSAPPAEILAAVDRHGVLAPSFQGLRGRDELIEAMGNRRLASAPSQLNLKPRNIEVRVFFAQSKLQTSIWRRSEYGVASPIENKHMKRGPPPHPSLAHLIPGLIPIRSP